MAMEMIDNNFEAPKLIPANRIIPQPQELLRPGEQLALMVGKETVQMRLVARDGEIFAEQVQLPDIHVDSDCLLNLVQTRLPVLRSEVCPFGGGGLAELATFVDGLPYGDDTAEQTGISKIFSHFSSATYIHREMLIGAATPLYFQFLNGHVELEDFLKDGIDYAFIGKQLEELIAFVHALYLVYPNDSNAFFAALRTQYGHFGDIVREMLLGVADSMYTLLYLVQHS